VLDPARRWSPGFKQNVWNSRVNTTSLLTKAIMNEDPKDRPEVFINISGVSCYKPNPNKVYTEYDPVENYDYMSELCIEWEKAATLEKSSGVRNVKLRTGVVLGREGGMIQQLFFPFFFGAGGPVGPGTQPLPWIHVEDLCNLIKYSLENKQLEGVFNAVAPDIITNKDFAKAFGKAMWRPALFMLPEQMVNWYFSKERAVLLTTGAQVQPKRTLESGFKYKYPEIFPACKQVSRLFMH
jgi:uncharacterized protein (TIGR01777 family)